MQKHPIAMVQVGFTLVELVVVICIISALLSVAMPRLFGMQQSARIAKLQATRGAMASAANLVHSTYLARREMPDGKPCRGTNNIADNINHLCVEGGLIAIVNGYPQALTPGNGAGIITATGLVSPFNPSITQLAEEGYLFSDGGNNSNSILTIRLTGGTNPTNCSFTYSPAESGVLGTNAVLGEMLTTGC